jgi:cyclic lactone autoinducer peptide
MLGGIKMKKASIKIENIVLNAISKTVIKLGALTESSTCTWWFYQPEYPEQMTIYKRDLEIE